MVNPNLVGVNDVDTRNVLEEISKQDPIMKRLVQRIGYFILKPGGDYYESLVQSIVYQQLSGYAADAIYKKLLKELEGEVTPQRMSKLGEEQFKKAGISPQKIKYITDLTNKVISGELELRGLEQFENEDIISKLTEVKGIGRWTAQMFLIFTLGRLDVLPLNDLGFRRALQKQYNLKGKVTDKRIEKIAKKWSPYKTVGVWMLWESDNIKLPTTG